MKKISAFLDTVLTFAALALFCAVTVGYFTRKTTIIILCSVTVAAAVTYIIRILIRRHDAPKALRRKRSEILNGFMFNKSNYAYDFALNAISKKCSPEQTNGLISSGKTAFKVLMIPEKISAADLAFAYSAASDINAEKLVIMSAYGAAEDAQTVADLLSEPSVEIWDFDKVYDFFASLGCEPTETLKLQPKKKEFSQVLWGAINRRNAKRYLFGAIVLLLWARFIPYSVAYVCVASVCITLALVCLLYNRRPAKKRK